MNETDSNKELLISKPKPSTDVIKKRTLIIIGVILVLVIAGLVVGSIFLLKQDNAGIASQMRDLFIIFMALETLIVGIALLILIVQLALLTNLLQNEVRPLLDNTNETVNTLKGTVRFLSDNLAEPVIKINQSVAMGKRLIDLLKPNKK